MGRGEFRDRERHNRGGTSLLGSATSEGSGDQDLASDDVEEVWKSRQQRREPRDHLRASGGGADRRAKHPLAEQRGRDLEADCFEPKWTQELASQRGRVLESAAWRGDGLHESTATTATLDARYSVSKCI